MKKNIYKPLVSVIMSEYNTNEQLLKKSIDSILKQTYQNFEIILIDDCGKNDVKSIVEKFKDERIRVYKNEKNSGLVFSLNKAIKLANGELIARMDTDDYAYPERFEKEVDFLQKHPEFDLVSTRADFFDGKKIWGESKFAGNIDKKNLLNGTPIIHPTVIMKKDAIKKIGGYLNYHRCEDYATWIELYINNYKMYVLDEKTIMYHLSIDDYKKRKLSTRKGFFSLLNSEYLKLNPTKSQIIKLKIKTIIAGIIPGKIMYTYHRLKGKKKSNER